MTARHAPVSAFSYAPATGAGPGRPSASVREASGAPSVRVNHRRPVWPGRSQSDNTRSMHGRRRHGPVGADQAARRPPLPARVASSGYALGDADPRMGACPTVSAALTEMVRRADSAKDHPGVVGVAAGARFIGGVSQVGRLHHDVRVGVTLATTLNVPAGVCSRGLDSRHSTHARNSCTVA